ncbi:MAG: site-specific recombinase resolvase [Ottowia sp.]|nr:site-specific recombinase resolvase [Ottowia sp.]
MNSALETFVPLQFKRRGVQRLASTAVPLYDTTFLEGLGRAFYWQQLIDRGLAKSGSDIARREKLHPSTVNELLRLTLLAPDIIDNLMAGKQPRTLTLMWFQRHRLPVDWHVQRAIIAQFE